MPAPKSKKTAKGAISLKSAQVSLRDIGAGDEPYSPLRSDDHRRPKKGPILNISRTEPVTARHLKDLRSALRLTTDDTKFAFGLASNRLIEMTSDKSDRLDEPLSRPNVAMLVRLYNQYPDLVPVPERLLAREVYYQIGGHMKRFSLLLGMEGAAAFRWLRRNDPSESLGSVTSDSLLSPTTERLARILLKFFDEGRQREWVQMVEGEALSRGVSDIFRTGSWTTKEEKRRRAAEKAKEKEKASRKAKARAK